MSRDRANQPGRVELRARRQFAAALRDLAIAVECGVDLDGNDYSTMRAAWTRLADVRSAVAARQAELVRMAGER